MVNVSFWFGEDIVKVICKYEIIGFVGVFIVWVILIGSVLLFKEILLLSLCYIINLGGVVLIKMVELL